MACIREAYSAARSAGSPLAGGRADMKRCWLACRRMVASPLCPITSWMASMRRRTRALGMARPASLMGWTGQVELKDRVAKPHILKTQIVVDAQRGRVGVLRVHG